MSLLMDALRKAEEAKRAAAQAGAPSLADAPPPAEASPAELSLEPLEHSAVPAAETVRASADRLEPKRPVAPAHTTAPTAAQRSAIQNAFAAKSPTKASTDKAFIVAIAAVSGLCLLGGGIYIWLQTQPRNSLAMPPMANTQAHSQVAALPPLPAPIPPPQNTAVAPLQPATQQATANPPASMFANGSANEGVTPREERRDATYARPAADPVRVTRSKSRINPQLEEGYAALQQGNYAQAQQAYERALGSDPKSLDALYGLAAIAVARQQQDLAEDYFLRILEIDPRDPVAQAGLTARAGSSAESRLKTLIADQPDVPQLQFALGNVYAQSQRWRDAQQAYFLAFKNDSENPDTAFNLAVSLDQLHQAKLAAQYYTEALRLAGNRPATFSRAQAQSRLAQLQGTVTP